MSRSVYSRGILYLTVLVVFAGASVVFAATEAASTRQAQVISHQYPMMGTTVEIRVSAPAKKAPEAEKAIEKARKDMEEFVHVVNAWDATSDVSRINRNAGIAPVSIDPRLMKLLLHTREISDLSGGAFDVTFFPLGLAWNLRTANPVIPTDKAIAEAKALVNYRDLVLDPAKGTAFLRRAGMQMELGAVAKGAAVDVGIASLRKSGIENALVRGSGDMFALGSKDDGPWTIGIQNPRGSRGEPIGIVHLHDQAATTSGDYEKMAIINGKRYCHIIDPRTGYPAEKTISVTVIGSNAETADALSTALFVLGPKDGLALCKKLHVEALFIDPGMKITKTPGFPNIIERKVVK